jgi:hypothetical protein
LKEKKMIKPKRIVRKKIIGEPEVPLYDWSDWKLTKVRKSFALVKENQRWKTLIYQNRKPSVGVDLGIERTPGVLGKGDILYVLFKKNLLTGQAFDDADMIYGKLAFS